MASQVPAGALVDAIANKTRVAAFSVLVFTASALMFAIYPIPLFVYLAEILHGISSCTLGPAIAAMSLALAGRFGMGLRLGRNARYAAVGNGAGPALMGACGQYVSERAVFYLTAALTLPALFALLPLRRFAVAADDVQPRAAGADGAAKDCVAAEDRVSVWHVLADRRLLIFCGCAMLFTFANAPMLMLISGTLTAKGSNPSLLIAACIVLPQIIVALASPTRRPCCRTARPAARADDRLFDVAVAGPVLCRDRQSGPVGGAAGVRRHRRRLFRHHGAADRERRGRALRAFQFVAWARSDSPSASAAPLSTPAAGWLADHFGMRLAFFASPPSGSRRCCWWRSQCRRRARPSDRELRILALLVITSDCFQQDRSGHGRAVVA